MLSKSPRPSTLSARMNVTWSQVRGVLPSLPSASFRRALLLHSNSQTQGLAAPAPPPRRIHARIPPPSLAAALKGGRGSRRAAAHQVFAARQEPRPPTAARHRSSPSSLRVLVSSGGEPPAGMPAEVWHGCSGRGCGGGEPLRLRMQSKRLLEAELHCSSRQRRL